jgi:hypothetical protein
MVKIFSLLFQVLTGILCYKIYNKFIDIFASYILKMFPAKGHKSSQGSPHGHPQGSPGPGGPNGSSTVLASSNSNKHDKSHKDKKVPKTESLGLYRGEVNMKHGRIYWNTTKHIKNYEDEAIKIDHDFRTGDISYETYCKEMNIRVERMKKLRTSWIKKDNFDVADSIDINKEYEEYNKKYSSEYWKYVNEKKNKKN